MTTTVPRRPGRPKRSARERSLPASTAAPVVEAALVRTGTDTRSRAQRVLDYWLSGRKETTRKAYAGDLAMFATFLGVDRDTDAIEMLIKDGPGRANELVMDYIRELQRREYAKGTIARYVASLKSATKIARLIGATSWRIEIAPESPKKFLDTEGVPYALVQRVLAHLDRLAVTAKGFAQVIALRDRAVIRTLWGGALRRNELVTLDLVHVRPPALLLLGKGRTEREPFFPAPSVFSAIEDWKSVRQKYAQDGAVFSSLADCCRGERLAASGVYEICRSLIPIMGLTEEEEFKARPHAWRHAAITRVARTQGLLAATAFARHADPKMTMRYIDTVGAQQKAAGAVLDEL